MFTIQAQLKMKEHETSGRLYHLACPRHPTQIEQIVEVLGVFGLRSEELSSLLEKYPLEVSAVDDGSVAIDWQMPNLILNLDIEEDPEETSWTLSSTEKAGLYAEGGNFKTTKNVIPILNELLDKILAVYPND